MSTESKRDWAYMWQALIFYTVLFAVLPALLVFGLLTILDYRDNKARQGNYHVQFYPDPLGTSLLPVLQLGHNCLKRPDGVYCVELR